MIKYNLSCKKCDHSFDSWFSSSEEFERLKKKNFINCHNCQSLDVIKSLMSPNIFNTKNSKNVINPNKKFQNMKKKIKKYQKFIQNNFEYVGKNFTYEARSIRYSNKKRSRGIYGIASKDEIKELKEEGIKTEIIPWINENDN